MLPVPAVRRVVGEELGVGAEQLERELRQPLGRLRPLLLEDRTLRARDAGLHQRRERPVGRVAQRLQLDPLLRDRVALQRRGAAVAGQLDQLPDHHLERSREGEAERAALVQQRRHRDLPAAADLADHVLDGHLDAGEEDLVELRLAGDLAERPHLDAGSLHVDDQVRQPRVAHGGGIAAGDEDAPVCDVGVGRPHLLAVDDEVGAFEPSARAHGREVGACAGLREALAPDLVCREERLEVAGLLGLGAERDDRRPGHPEPDHAEVLRRLGARRLLEIDRLVAVRLAATAVLLRPGEPDVARVVERAAPVADRVVRVPRRAAAMATQLRRHVRLEPRVELAAELRLVGGVAKIHGVILECSPTNGLHS